MHRASQGGEVESNERCGFRVEHRRSVRQRPEETELRRLFPQIGDSSNNRGGGGKSVRDDSGFMASL